MRGRAREAGWSWGVGVGAGVAEGVGVAVCVGAGDTVAAEAATEGVTLSTGNADAAVDAIKGEPVGRETTGFPLHPAVNSNKQNNNAIRFFMNITSVFDFYDYYKIVALFIKSHN